MSIGLLLWTAFTDVSCAVPARYLVHVMGGSVLGNECVYAVFSVLLVSSTDRVHCDVSCFAGYYCAAGSLYPRPCPLQHYCPSYGTAQPVPCNASQYSWPGASSCSDTIPLEGMHGGPHGICRCGMLNGIMIVSVCLWCYCIHWQSLKSQHLQVLETEHGRMGLVDFASPFPSTKWRGRHGFGSCTCC
jgi:hypothetical protein